MHAVSLKPIPPDVATLTARRSAERKVDARTVRSRTLLNLLRFDVARVSDVLLIDDEVRNTVEWAATRCANERWRLAGPGCDRLEAKTASFHRVEAGTASHIIEAFHFLGYARAEQYFGVSIRSGGTWHLAAVTSLAAFDLEYLRPLFGSAADDALVITRLYSMPWAPRNTLTYLLGSLRQHLRTTAPRTTLVTFCNPNAGHRGTTYDAAGWRLFARQRQRRLYYVDGQYVSVRQAQSLSAASGARLAVSRQPLQDLLLFCRGVTDRASRFLPDTPHIVLSPETVNLENAR